MTSFPAWEFALSQQRAGTWQTGFSNKVSMLEGNCSCGYRESDDISIHPSSYSGWHEYMWGGINFIAMMGANNLALRSP